MLKTEPQSAIETTAILGVPVDRLSTAEFLTRIEALVAAGGSHMVVTADSSMIYDAQTDPVLKDIIERADLVTPDSSGVIWAGNRIGRPFPEKVSGVDLVDHLCALSALKGYRIFLLGAEPGVAETAAEKLRLKHPGCNIVGARHGYFPAESDAVVAEEVGQAEPDILFVAMGIPRQEKFIDQNRDLHKAKVGIGVGGSFDVYAGKAKRAPVFFQKARLEWLWRFILNPSKYKKTMKLPKFMFAVLRAGRKGS
jgi:N-acetylglucosaminyldiphosphoundecaprenol N-acetyl-beta-D-mannosaminyltransferase